MSFRDPQPFVGVGLHLGQDREPTGFCVAQIQDRTGPLWAEDHFPIRHLDRLCVRPIPG